MACNLFPFIKNVWHLFWCTNPLKDNQEKYDDLFDAVFDVNGLVYILITDHT